MRILNMVVLCVRFSHFYVKSFRSRKPTDTHSTVSFRKERHFFIGGCKMETDHESGFLLSGEYVKGFIDGYTLSRKEKIEYFCYKIKIRPEDLEYFISGQYEKMYYDTFDKIYDIIKNYKTAKDR